MIWRALLVLVVALVVAGEDRWALSSVCADCLASPELEPVRRGAVAIGSVQSGPDDRCVICGFPLATQPDHPGPRHAAGVASR